MDLALVLWWDRLRVLHYTPLSSVILMLFVSEVLGISHLDSA